MKVAVLCCGCQRFMDVDGKPYAPLTTKGGVVLINGMFINLPSGDTSMIAIFPDHQSADIAAKEAGWQISDSEGPNHRCPKCALEHDPPVVNYRGAYVEFPD
jgi:hypothetical protein